MFTSVVQWFKNSYIRIYHGGNCTSYKYKYKCLKFVFTQLLKYKCHVQLLNSGSDIAR